MEYTVLPKDHGLPDRIRILGIEYRIDYVDNVDREILSYGKIDYMNCTIRIDRSIPTSVKYQTLIHEVLHGLCNAFCMDDLGNNETAIQSLASGLYSVLSENIGFDFERDDDEHIPTERP